MGVESGKALIEQEGLQGALVAITSAAEVWTGEPLGKFLGSVEAQTLPRWPTERERVDREDGGHGGRCRRG